MHALQHWNILSKMPDFNELARLSLVLDRLVATNERDIPERERL